MTKKLKVIIEVHSGVAYVTECPDEVEVVIVDTDVGEELWTVEVISDLYGVLEFDFDTYDEAIKGISLMARVAKGASDGLERQFRLINGGNIKEEWPNIASALQAELTIEDDLAEDFLIGKELLG